MRKSLSIAVYAILSLCNLAAENQADNITALEMHGPSFYSNVSAPKIEHKTLQVTYCGYGMDPNCGNGDDFTEMITAIMGEQPYTAMEFRYKNWSHYVTVKKCCYDFIDTLKIGDKIEIDTTIYPFSQNAGDYPFTVITDVRKVGNKNIDVTPLSSIVKAVRKDYTDVQLKESMITICDDGFKDIDSTDIALMYVYITRSKKDDDSVGIRSEIVYNLCINNEALDKAIIWCKKYDLDYNSLFVDKLLTSFIGLNTKDNPTSEELRRIIPVGFINAFYDTDDGMKYLQSKLNYWKSKY